MTSPFKISELLATIFQKPHENNCESNGENNGENDNSHDDMISLNDIMLQLHDRGFGMLILLFSMLNAIPLVATAFALPQIIIAAQMMLKYDAPKLPNFIAKKQIKRATLQMVINKSIPYIKRVEIIIKPRLGGVLQPKFERIIACFLLLFTLVIAVPGPLTNFVPSIGMFIIGMGILMHDGLAVIIGIIIGLIWTYFLIFLYSELIMFINSMF